MGKINGEERVVYAKAESTYGTAVKPAATDAMRGVLQLTPDDPDTDVPETNGSRSLQDTTEGRRGGSWTFSCLNRPSGTAGTPPDFHLMLKHALGTYANTASTSDAYTLAADPTGLSMALYDYVSEDMLEVGYGSVVGNWAINWLGNGHSTFECGGRFKDMGHAGVDAANGAGSSSSSLTVDDGDFFSKYGVIKIGSEDNSGAGIQITGVSGETVTLESTFSWSDNDAVVPFIPAPTVAGDPLFGTAGSLSFDGNSTTIAHISGGVQGTTGIGLFNEEFGADSATAVILEPRGRRIGFNFEFLLEDNGNYAFLRGEARNRTVQDIQVDVGTTGGKICRITAPRARLSVSPHSGGDGFLRMSLTAKALASTTTATEDEVAVTYL